MTLRCDSDGARGWRVGDFIDAQNSHEFIRLATACRSQTLAMSITLGRLMRCLGTQLGSITCEGMLCVAGGLE
jgi:hypothetical protein